MMDSYKISPCIFVFTFLSIISNVDVHAQSNNFIVTDFGAVSDGKTDNKQAFVNAWKKACDTEGGIVSVPKGTFFVSGGDFEGPCNGRTLFHMDGTVVADSDFDPTAPPDHDYWLAFSKVDALTLSGNGGVFDGNGASCWSHCSGSANCNTRPTTLKMNYVTNALIQGIHLVNSKMFHLHIHESQNVQVRKVQISAPENSPNTDGIHVGSSSGVGIFDSSIGTGDDCVSMGDGSRDVNVSGVWCGPGHGFSIGSLGKYKMEQDVAGITVRNCTLNRTDNGLRIKTWAPSLSSNVVSDVTFAEINVDGVGNPIIIDQYYCPAGSCGHGGESSVQVKGVRYVDIKGTSTMETAVNIRCSKSKKCEDIEFVGLDISFDGKPTTALCSGVDDRFRGSDQVPSRCS